MFDLSGVSDWLGDVGGIIDQGIGIFGDVRRAGKDDFDVHTMEPDTTGPPYYPTYNPNISAKDFAFTPNWYLIGGGLLILTVAVILGRR